MSSREFALLVGWVAVEARSDESILEVFEEASCKVG